VVPSLNVFSTNNIHDFIMSDKFTIHEDMSFLNPNFEINREFKKSYPNNGKRKT